MTEQLDPTEPTTKRERELRDRAVRDYAALTALALDTGRTFYAPGTEAVVAINRGTIKAVRNRHDALPPASEVLEALSARIGAEDRTDNAANIGGGYEAMREAPDAWWLQPNLLGGWGVNKVGERGYDLAPTEHAFQQLISCRPPGHPAPGPDVAAWLSDATTHEAILRTRKLPPNRESKYPGRRECYAIVSPSYKPYDLDRAATDLMAVVPADARGKVRYDGARATVDVVLQNPYYLDGGDAAAVGETHRVVLRMKTADDGSGGYHLQLLAERVRCINLTLLHAKRSLFHGTHRSEELASLAQEALASIGPTMEQFAETWRGAWLDYYTDKHTGNVTGEEAIRRIVAWGKYRVRGLGSDGTLDACLVALAEEPGDSKAHVHNALTRAAHTAPVTWATRWADDEAEEQASQLLYQKVQWLPEVAE